MVEVFKDGRWVKELRYPMTMTLEACGRMVCEREIKK
jgi:hypothetical protein